MTCYFWLVCAWQSEAKTGGLNQTSLLIQVAHLSVPPKQHAYVSRGSPDDALTGQLTYSEEFTAASRRPESTPQSGGKLVASETQSSHVLGPGAWYDLELG